MDKLEMLIDAVMRLQNALQDMGVHGGATHIILPDGSIGEFEMAVKSSPSVLNSLPVSLGSGVNPRQVCGVHFTERDGRG